MCMLPPFFSPYFSIYLEGLETFHGLFAELRHAFSRCRPTANSTPSRALVLSSLSLTLTFSLENSSHYHSRALARSLSLSLSQSLAIERELSSSSTLEVSLAYALVLAPADSPISSSNTMALG